MAKLQTSIDCKCLFIDARHIDDCPNYSHCTMASKSLFSPLTNDPCQFYQTCSRKRPLIQRIRDNFGWNHALLGGIDKSMKHCIVVVYTIRVILKIGGMLDVPCGCHANHFQNGCHVKLIIRQQSCKTKP